MNERLETLSDKVRRGIPIDIDEAVEVIEYQYGLSEKREKSFWLRLKHWARWRIWW